MTPNQPRNLGIREAATRNIVFVDNDVLVMSGWLVPSGRATSLMPLIDLLLGASRMRAVRTRQTLARQ
jgi:hypothetical protein